MRAERFEVGVVGAGYVGLVTGACLASAGHRVTVVDKDAGRVASLSEGSVPIHEPDLGELVSEGLDRGLLSFTMELECVAREGDVLFIAVDTPQGDDGSADLSNVAAVARSVGRVLAGSERENPLIVVNKSTVPVGSGDYVSMLIEEGVGEDGDAAAADYRVVSNPEFLREGNAVGDSLSPGRIVLGSDSEYAIEIMRELYDPVVERGDFSVPVVATDLASAEMIKYASNAFLATKISFINEVANVCELVGADVESVAEGMGLDERIGPRFLSAGIGWGGSCFPKDVAALRSIAREYDYEPVLLDSVSAVNEAQRRRVVSKLQRELRTLKGKRVALLGLAFKPGTDDLREAPSLRIARALIGLGARVVGYDPVASEAAARMLPDLKLASEPYEALTDAHAAVLVTEWEELRELDLALAAALMRSPKLLVDGRNALDPDSASAAGLLYHGFGRAESPPKPEPPDAVRPAEISSARIDPRAAAYARHG